MRQPHHRTLIVLGLAALVAVVSGAAGCAQQQRSRPDPVPSSDAGTERREAARGVKDKDASAAELSSAVERFIKAGDSGDLEAVIAAYDPGFISVRVADEGGSVQLTREQMVQFWKRTRGPTTTTATAPVFPTKDTKIHHVDVVGETGFVLLTRTKNLGRGWEPMFYSLVWRRLGGEWKLLREFVHQRSLPRGR